MNCPKCEPASKSRRWVWWSLILVTLVIVAWLDRSGSL